MECLTISSDEEDEEAEESEPHVSSNSDCSDISSSLINKEPPLIDAYDDAKFSDSGNSYDPILFREWVVDLAIDPFLRSVSS